MELCFTLDKSDCYYGPIETMSNSHNLIIFQLKENKLYQDFTIETWMSEEELMGRCLENNLSIGGKDMDDLIKNFRKIITAFLKAKKEQIPSMGFYVKFLNPNQ